MDPPHQGKKEGVSVESMIGQGIRSILLVAALCVAVLSFAAPAQAANDASISIVGGQKTSIKKWPWQVGLAVAPSRAPGKKPSERFFCGGSLIAPTMIVTAAHCAYEIDLSKPEYFSVIAGRTRLDDTSTGVEVLAEDAFFPTTRSGIPRYMLLFDIRWDLALVELSQPVAMPPIKLVGPDEQALIAPGRRAITTGWGLTAPKKNKAVSKVLVEGKTSIQPSRACSYLQDGGFLPPFDSDSQVCIGDLGGRSSPCNGDSGGPAVVRSSDGYRLFGATSYGLAADCSPSLPSTDAALAKPDVRDWIAGITVAETGIDPVGSGASVPPLGPRCRVPMLEDRRVDKAKTLLRGSDCRFGRISYQRLPRKQKLKRFAGRILISDPSPFMLRNRGAKVNMLVGKWRPKPKARR